MRMLIAVLGGICWLLTSLANGEPPFPYTTTCISDDVYVRSGPGQNYYPTDKLKRGQEVEVYRHDPGGWCAIRPVEGSSTWVSGRFLKPTEDNLAVVTENDVSARVGSRFSEVRDVVQVRLHKGEAVEVIEGPPHGSGWGQNTWFKIAPPAGEFRWVASKYLSNEYPREGVRKAPPPEKEPYRPDLAPDPHAMVPREARAPMIPAAALPGNGFHEADGESYRARSTRPRSLSPEEFQAELDRIEFELSVMVIEDPAAWSFEALHERTNYLLDGAQTAVERGRARLLTNKIARFDDIKQRQEAVWAMRSDIDRSSRLLTKLRPHDRDIDSSTETSQLQTDGRYDGIGRLTQVVSPKLGAPRYALVDKKTGNVQCYVTPAPGVQLQNYVDRDVGINGTRGYMPEQRAGHITARHVTPLDSSMLR